MLVKTKNLNNWTGTIDGSTWQEAIFNTNMIIQVSQYAVAPAEELARARQQRTAALNQLAWTEPTPTAPQQNNRMYLACIHLQTGSIILPCFYNEVLEFIRKLERETPPRNLAVAGNV